ncbi:MULTISPECIES: hypothetical protein [Vibrio]|uniref:hypothetical protein n=1 Tax=Vibrio TaxID=662 RepID=UPI0020755D0D|nr:MULTISPECIES: hypothetical protein [Vibrio]USD33959.1 hypothetical protein J8Z27_07700 [Vibrio sp. SCSIO 43186]USD44229.1 hypothetical protein J4N38_08085 [Vibrio sp. SCSIO 43145]USD71083.1 hypothetical protein J4N41_07705 [Vibrio sp. SCSIO 43139]USD95988.1 hypothetical protein CTT30_07805 [Vibrio coralliilyticus]
MAWYELLSASLGLIFGTYATVWAIPAVIMNAIVSLGSFRHIIFMDKQLAKDLDKYYDDYGYMRPKYQLSWEIASRCFDYWFKYPFIRKRSTTKSIKFKVFMWVNALGMWSCIILILNLIFLKLTGFIP